MTNKERLVSLIGFSPGNDNSLEGALADLGLTSTDPYVLANKNLVKTAAIEVMLLLISTADTSNAEVGFMIKYDREALLKLIDQYKVDLGLLGTSIIRDVSYLW